MFENIWYKKSTTFFIGSIKLKRSLDFVEHFLQLFSQRSFLLNPFLLVICHYIYVNIKEFRIS